MANAVRPSFATLMDSLASPAGASPPTGTTAAAAGAGTSVTAPATSTPCHQPGGRAGLLDVLLAPPWVTVSEAGAMETSSLERTAVFLRHWHCWLQQHRPADAVRAAPALSNQGFMVERRKAGLQLLLEGLLAADPAFGSMPKQQRLEVFLVCAGIRGSVDQALTKLDSAIRWAGCLVLC